MNQAQRADFDHRLKEKFGKLLGRKITDVRSIAPEEAKALDLVAGGDPYVMIQLDGHCAILLMCDPEGNGPGFMEVLTTEPTKGQR